MKWIIGIVVTSAALFGLGVVYVPAVGNAVRFASEKTGVPLPKAAESSLAGGSHARFSTDSPNELRELSEHEGTNYNKVKWPGGKSEQEKKKKKASPASSVSGLIENIAPDPEPAK